MMNNTIDFIIGDWLGNGHGRTEIFAVRVNKSKNEIIGAFKRAAEEHGLAHLDNEYIIGVAQDSEEDFITPEYTRKLRAAGLQPTEYSALRLSPGFDETKDNIYMSTDTYLELWLDIAGLYLKDLDYQIIIPDREQIYCGGEGLFMNC